MYQAPAKRHLKTTCQFDGGSTLSKLYTLKFMETHDERLLKVLINFSSSTAKAYCWLVEHNSISWNSALCTTKLAGLLREFNPPRSRWYWMSSGIHCSVQKVDTLPLAVQIQVVIPEILDSSWYPELSTHCWVIPSLYFWVGNKTRHLKQTPTCQEKNWTNKVISHTLHWKLSKVKRELAAFDLNWFFLSNCKPEP